MKNHTNRINANLKSARVTHAAFVAGLHARIVFDTEQVTLGAKPAVSPEWDRALKWATTDTDGSIRQIACLGKAFDFAGFTENLPKTLKGTDTYIACKVAEKVTKFVTAVFTQNPVNATDYVVQVLFNALHNNGALHIDDVFASLSRRSMGTECANLVSRGSYTKGTAGAQGSQVRMLAKALKFADVIKGKRGDIMQIKPELMPELCDLFGVEIKPAETV